MRREYYSDTIAGFLASDPRSILGELTDRSEFAVDVTQRDAWLEEIGILQRVLPRYSGRGKLYFEFAIPRLGKRIDVLLLLGPAVFVLESKVHERSFTPHALDQVWDYALDLKNFHESSHDLAIAPILVATAAAKPALEIQGTVHRDGLLRPIRSNAATLVTVIEQVLLRTDGPCVDPAEWEKGRYCPTPTIVEAAMALYNHHSVADIARSDASAANLNRTSGFISDLIQRARRESRKAICFVTGVPGAGKTLVGLDAATRHTDRTNDLYSVFLSGNGPLVAVLREALARDRVSREASRGLKIRKGEARSEAGMFIQNVHHFRDE